MQRLMAVMGLVALAVSAQTPRGWTQGKGYGWVYGKDDQLGAVNAINTPGQILAAFREVKTGKVYDLGVRVDRSSFKWPGHSPTEILSFRSPAGLKTSKDIALFATHPKGVALNSCALFISDNLGTQIDGLGHVVTGQDNHWYNGFRSSDHGTDFGVMRADADSIPPIIARAVLIDVAGWKGVDALPSRFAIGSKELQAALELQKTAIQPGDVVLIRTGTLRYWGETGADHTKLGEHDSAGITLEAAKWLVEQKGASMIGADTSGIEHEGGIAVHEYLLIEQGVHILEFHNLEELARNKVYRFTYVAMTNRLKGTVAGTALRPIALE